MMQSSIVVRFQAEGWHRWPEASGQRSYLAERHRHMFHVTVQMAVTHDDREVEFHDLLADARTMFGAGEFGRCSCETLAKTLIEALRQKYGDRALVVSAFEDGEVGAVVQYTPDSLYPIIR